MFSGTQCDSVSTLIDGRKIIPSCSILPPHTCTPARLDAKNAIRCLSHQNTLLTYKSLAIISHAITKTLHTTVYILHNVIEQD
jgi:hypothetical protein